MYLKPRDLALRWNLSERTILHHINLKRIPATRFFGVWRIEESDALAYEQQSKHNNTNEVNHVEF